MTASDLAHLVAAVEVDEALDTIGSGGFLAAAFGMVAVVTRMLLNRSRDEEAQTSGWRLLVDAQQAKIVAQQHEIDELLTENAELRATLRRIDDRRPTPITPTRQPEGPDP